MRKLISAVLSLMLCMSIYAQPSVLSIKPSQIEAGGNVRFTYTGKLAKEGTLIKIKFFDTKSVTLKSIQTKLKGNRIEGKFNVPDSIVYVSFSITNGDETDRKGNDNLGYDFNVYRKGKPVKGTFLKQGSILSVLGDGKGVVDLLEKEYTLYPEQRAQSYDIFLNVLLRTKDRKDEAITLAQKLFDETMQSGTDDRFMATYTYIICKADRHKRDSLEKEVIKRFPKGRLSFNKKLFELYNVNDPDKVFLLQDSLQKEFPENCKQAKSSIDKVLTIAYRKKKDYTNFEKYLSYFKDKGFLADQYNEMAWEMVLADIKLPIAKAYSEKALETMDSLKKGEKPEYFPTQKEWEENLGGTTGNYLDTYALILSKLGSKKEAAEIQLQSVELTKAKNVRINERLVKFLIDDNQLKEALTRAEEFLISDKSNNKIDSLYDVAYISLNGSTTGLAATKAKMVDKMKDAPDFSIKGLDGKTVTLSSLKGKIVILDLWATWCGPCLASFSGMQKAVDALKDNKDVCFYFVNTFERTTPEKRLEDIQKVIENKKVNFNILLDELNGTDYLLGKLYGVTGIPTKIIIDKNGKIRSTLVGYSGNDVELVNELKAIVEKLM
jgi:thiol-disulfide isomerase/thioredoxin